MQAAVRGAPGRHGMTLTSPPGAMTGDRLSWLKDARVFIVFLPQAEKNALDYLQVLVPQSSPDSTLGHPRAAGQRVARNLG